MFVMVMHKAECKAISTGSARVNRKLESRTGGEEEGVEGSRISIAFKSLSNLGNWTNWH